MTRPRTGARSRSGRPPAGRTGFRVLGPGGVDLPALVRMPGTFNVANGLLAIATLATVGRAAR